MAKEWDKFSADYKKMAPTLKTYTEDAAEAVSKRFSLAYANAQEGENYLAESMVDAREKGVTGTTLADFMKDAGFKQAFGLFDKACQSINTTQAALEKYCTRASAFVGDLKKLHDAIEKDLKSRKDKSESKKDIESLRDKIKADMVMVTKASKRYSNQSKGKIEYVANQKKTVEAILKQAPEAQKKAKDDTMLPQQLQDRNMNTNANKADKFAKSIGALCDSAMKKAETDLKDALPDLKKAGGDLVELKKLNDLYLKIVKDYGKDIDNSKDKAKQMATIKKITTLYTASERKFRGTATTIKKAG